MNQDGIVLSEESGDSELGSLLNNISQSNNTVKYNTSGKHSIEEDNSLKKSTLLHKLNSCDYNGAANEFLKWNKLNGKVLNGLVRKRQEEKELFLKNNYLSNKSYKGVSLVDALKQIKVDTSFSNRKRLAKNNEISNYSGTYSQNLKLLNLLKQGKLNN